MIVCIRDNNIILSINSHSAGLGELTLEDPELPELAVVDHLLPLDLGLGRVEGGHGRHRGGRQVGAGHELGRQVNHITWGLRQAHPVLNIRRLKLG